MYDPFYWYERELDREAEAQVSEFEHKMYEIEKRYEEENMENKIEIDLDAITKRRD